MRLIILSLIIFTLFSCSNSNKTDQDNTNQSDSRSTIKKDMSKCDTLDNLFNIENEAELIEIFGKENVIFDTVYGGEGEMSMATLLFPGKKDELEIIWADMDKRIEMLSITHSSFYDMENDILLTNTRWKTSYGIQLGTSLVELNEMNEGSFTFMGFAWDYGGMISDLNEGKLSKIPLILQLGIADYEALDNNSDYQFLMGDMEFLSDLKEAKRLNPVVLTFSISRANK